MSLRAISAPQRVSLRSKIPFPCTEITTDGDVVSVCARLFRVKADHLVLAGPLRRQVGEESDAHAMGKSAVDGRFDQIGCEKSKRDCHLDLSRAAVFPLRDAVGTCCWISDQFIKPTATTGNRCD
jgi:hypothetical protein